MMPSSWRARLGAAAFVATLLLAGCGGDDGAGVRTIDDGGSASGSGSASGPASGSGSGSGTGSQDH